MSDREKTTPVEIEPESEPDAEELGLGQIWVPYLAVGTLDLRHQNRRNYHVWRSLG